MKGPVLTLEIGASRWLTYMVIALRLLAVTALMLADVPKFYRVPPFSRS